MGTTRRRPATIATTMAATARELRLTIRAADPAQPPGVAQLREAGRQPADLVALPAEHPGHRTQRPGRLRRLDDAPATPPLGCRELATPRHVLNSAHRAARDYCTEIRGSPQLYPVRFSLRHEHASPPGPPNPYAVLGLSPNGGAAEITAAYRRAVRDCHPDAPHPDRDRLAAVIAAYRQLRDHPARQATDEPRRHPTHGRDVPVRVHPRTTPPAPDVRAGPVHRHPDRT
ncbi:J domain-containing protein [Amycolatopsis sp. FDAARGOS 1241]|uniref:J domain-containing protein n=1 Tax=Amycolatopsis sp. FDAARGOS 1241 TaxID=2778070 RepID=UPI001950E983|nr:J domain-containing protein [Amycolatopsis sp. FDAARGOS 1241]QRP44741.1 J domain-containing protein [Amycolatopsis sp. FDAARGOS 1241]